MLMVVSPAKNLDYETAPKTKQFSQPEFLEDSQLLMDELLKLAPHDLSELMSISDKLGTLNYDRNQSWKLPFDQDNAKQAVLAFNGDVYSGLDAPNFSAADFKFAQKHLRILSGLYGLLKPLDLMQAYRLEMGTKFNNKRGKNLYEFWGSIITDALNAQLKKNKGTVLLNLASNEYFKAVKPKQLAGTVVAPVFKDWKNGQYKIISFYAKKARGLMAAYVIKNQITEIEDIKKFDSEGYCFNTELSDENNWIFTREHED